MGIPRVRESPSNSQRVVLCSHGHTGKLAATADVLLFISRCQISIERSPGLNREVTRSQ